MTTPSELNKTWVQLTDGTSTKFISVLTGALEFFVSNVAPAPDAVGHVILTHMVSTPPTIIWGRSALSTSTMIVSSITS